MFEMECVAVFYADAEQCARWDKKILAGFNPAQRERLLADPSWRNIVGWYWQDINGVVEMIAE